MNARTLLVAGVVAVCLVSAGGCAPVENVDETELGSAASAAIGLNSLLPLALDATGVYPGALTPAMLAGNALVPGALSAAASAAITAPGASGTLSRKLLAYTVGCALGPTDTFSFTWTDASNETHTESDVGLFGLATDWAGGPLGGAEQGWVSACLIARTNYYGVPVSLSCRGGDAALTTTPAELSDYTYEEGAFWGNVFTASPTAYACDYVPDATHSEDAERVCATGIDQDGNPVSCGIIQQVGSCNTACEALSGPGGYYPGCTGNGLTSAVITVFLQ